MMYVNELKNECTNEQTGGREFTKTTKKGIFIGKTGNKIEIELKEIYYSRETDLESFRLKIWLKETPIFYFMANRDKIKFLPTKFGNRWKKKRSGHFRKIFI